MVPNQLPEMQFKPGMGTMDLKGFLTLNFKLIFLQHIF